ncbi:MAG TPA: hypothetical protein VGY31_15100 [Terriglobia bacterium]|nr:hypothetical protein [Terriglobia bacterium]
MADPDTDRIAKLTSRVGPWVFLVIAAVLAFVCVAAEERGEWFQAQVSLSVILVLFFLAGLVAFKARRVRRSDSPEVATYRQTLDRLLLFAAFGIAAILFNSIRYEHWVEGLVARAAGFGVLVAGAAFIVGVLIGFLFGFPSLSDSKGAPNNPPPKLLLYDTNLEQISEWLTKVILGASLVELSKLPPLVSALSTYIAAAVEPRNFHGGHVAYSTTSAPVATAILGYFWCCGVLYGYIYTKYEVVATAQGRGDDVAALAAVDQWLSDPHGLGDDKTRDRMMEVIRSATIAGKVRIFLKAEKYRKAGTEDANARALPIFQALVEADIQEIFHRNRGQYAIALMGRKKDPNNPTEDWHRALDLLDDAIRIRDRSGDPGWREYEQLRAECESHLNPAPPRQS